MGLLYNLEVKVRDEVDAQGHVHLEGGGLDQQTGPDQSKLSYSAPDEDGAPAVSGATEPGQPAGGAAGGATQRGAFGQQVPADGAASNRAARRANKKK